MTYQSALPAYLEERGMLHRLYMARQGDKKNYSNDIVGFVRDILHAEPADYQIDILNTFIKQKRIAVRGPHGLGKTALSSWVVLWAIATSEVDTKVVTTASAWRQLTKFTWPEVRKWAGKADWSMLGMDIRRGKELLELSIKLPNKEAFAVASDNPALIEGAHATRLVYVFDEAKAIPVGTWDAAEGAFSGAGGDTVNEAYALAISTPGESSGRFYDIHARKSGLEDWAVRHVTLDEAIAAGRISREWAEQRRKQWGENSAVYQNRVLGEFADSGEDSVVPLSWIEASNKRWLDCGGKGEGETTYGIDVARYGEDKTAFARLTGYVLEKLDYYAKQSTMETAGRAAATIDKQINAAVDTIGIGAGVFDRLQELGHRVLSVNVGESTDMKDSSGQVGFVNLRSAIWWMMREALDPESENPLALPPDDMLTGDLTAPLWGYTSKGQIKVESKDDIRIRIGRSTDAADALGLALYAAYKNRTAFTTFGRLIRKNGQWVKQVSSIT